LSNPVIQFSYVGYKTQEIAAKEQSVINLMMESDSQLVIGDTTHTGTFHQYIDTDQRPHIVRYLTGYRTFFLMMESDSQLVEEVVVTALGIKRATKALSYNVQERRSWH